jgi:TonB family protein
MEVSMKRHLLALLLLLIAFTCLAASQVVPRYVMVGQSVMTEHLFKRVDPIYPPLAKQARIQAIVVLKVVISKSGDVENVQLVSGHPMLAPAAIEAVKQWKYTPYVLNGDPVEVETQVTVNFTLSDKAPAEGYVGDNPGGGFSGVIPPPPGTAPNPARIRVSQAVMQGLLVTRVNPQYPQEAKDQRIQGRVVLSIIVDKDGNVANVEVISGHPMLAPPAMEAVKQWKYRPYLLNGEPIEVDTQVAVNFTLTQ